MAEQLARQTNGRAQIILLGRNRVSADRIIASLPRTPEGTAPSEESQYSFIKVDATSMEEIRNLTAKLSKEFEKINFIVVSPGTLTMKGRDETKEGIDRKMACNFYGRFRFIYDLVHLVEAAEKRGEQTGVMSVFEAGGGSAIDLDDLGLVKRFTLKKAHDHVVTYKDAVFEVIYVPLPLSPIVITPVHLSRNSHPSIQKPLFITFSRVWSSHRRSPSTPVLGSLFPCSDQSPFRLKSVLK